MTRNQEDPRADEFVERLAAAISAALPPGAEWWVSSCTFHPDPSGVLIIEEVAPSFLPALPVITRMLDDASEYWDSTSKSWLSRETRPEEVALASTLVARLSTLSEPVQHEASLWAPVRLYRALVAVANVMRDAPLPPWPKPWEPPASHERRLLCQNIVYSDRMRMGQAELLLDWIVALCNEYPGADGSPAAVVRALTVE